MSLLSNGTAFFIVYAIFIITPSLTVYSFSFLSHENASGYYRVSAFFLSKIFTDLIPLRFFPNAVFALITYFMIGILHMSIWFSEPVLPELDTKDVPQLEYFFI